MGVVASPPWTPADDGRLRELAAAGKSVATIAEQLKRSISAVRKRASKIGISVAKLRKR
jgi:hypothetical protein